MSSPPIVWTVGHSNHEFEDFARLVQGHDIDYLVDVRSYPYSRFAPYFNREELQGAMESRGVRYVFFGLELGGRPQQEDHFDAEGHALYGKMADQPAFAQAIDRVLRGASGHRLALLCSCGEPRDCHRRLLVGKVLCDRGAELRHILGNGSVMVERSVPLIENGDQAALFGDDEPPWRSAQSVSHRRRLSTSLTA